MKINFSQNIRNIDGSELQDSPTLKDIAIQALITPTEGDNQMMPQTKFSHGLLAQKIAIGGDIVEVTVEEVATLKDRIGKGFPPLVVLYAWQAFEAATNEKAAESTAA